MWLEEQLLCVWKGGTRSSLNRVPQLGFHNDINEGQAEPSAVQMGKLRQRLLPSLRGGLPSASEVHSSSGTAAQSAVTQGDTGGTAAGSPGHTDPLHSGHAEGYSPPPQLLGGEVPGSGACLPLLTCPRKAHF